MNTMKEGFSRKAFLVFNTVFFCVVLFLCLFPMWYVLMQSLSDGRLAALAIFLPKGFTFKNYQEILSRQDILQAFGISILRTVTGTACSVMANMLLGYIFSKPDVPFRKLLYRMLIITMYVSGGLIPTYLVYKGYGLLNTFWVYILPSIVGAYNVILIKTYVEQMPISVEESAMIDGAGTITIFLRIILPLALPIAATIAIYASVGQWNAWFDNQLYNASAKDLTTLQLLLYRYLNEAQTIADQAKTSGERISSSMITPRGVKMTVTMITVLPILCVYPFMQRYLIKGIMIGAVKG